MINAPAVQDLSGVKKAAALLIQLGTDASARILAELRDREVEELTAEIVRMRDLDPEIAGDVLLEFHDMVVAKANLGHGGFGFARELLKESLGDVRAGEILSRISAAVMEMPFQFLHKADARQLLSFLQDEHPQTIALVVAHMSADQASMVLAGLSPALQADVAHRIAVMDRTTPEVIRAVEGQLERKLSSVLQPTDFSEIGGLQPLVEIINRADRATERQILEGLDTKDPQLAEAIRSQLFTFEDIVQLEDRAVQLVMREVDSATLANALKGVRNDVRDKIMRNLSERAAQNLGEEIELMGPVRLSQVEEAQVKVVQAIRALEESGQIMVSRGGDEDAFVA